MQHSSRSENSGDFLFSEYLGITLEEQQCRLAQHRVRQLGRIKMFCADAGNPGSWNEELIIAVTSLASKPSETWLLALDTLYHFSPSRIAIFKYAFHSLKANIMAFDLLLADEAPTLIQKLLLHLVARATYTPFSNFLTEAQYKAQLVDAGYEADQIIIRDISGNVFSGLARFLEEQDERLKALGLGGVGAFNVARWVFGHWGRSGVVKGCIIVAKKSRHIPTPEEMSELEITKNQLDH